MPKLKKQPTPKPERFKSMELVEHLGTQRVYFETENGEQLHIMICADGTLSFSASMVLRFTKSTPRIGFLKLVTKAEMVRELLEEANGG